MPSTTELFPTGFGLKRVDPRLQYLIQASFGDITTSRFGTANARGSITAAAGTWQTLAEVTSGSGFFYGACLSTPSNSTGTSGLRITIDGTPFESTAANAGAGAVWTTPYDHSFDSALSITRAAFKPLFIPYSNSLKIEGLRGVLQTFYWAVWWAPEF